MTISRRNLIKSSALGSLALAMPNIVRAQQTTLKVVWMGWPDNQVLPLMAEFEKRNPTIKLALERMPFQQHGAVDACQIADKACVEEMKSRSLAQALAEIRVMWWEEGHDGGRAQSSLHPGPA